MSKHTVSPGPWEKQLIATDYKGYEGWDVYAVRSRHGNLCLAVVGEVDRATDKVNSGNASLMVAAPELLEACQYVVDWHREHDSGEGELFGLDFVTTCINAIRKAEGAS